MKVAYGKARAEWEAAHAGAAVPRPRRAAAALGWAAVAAVASWAAAGIGWLGAHLDLGATALAQAGELAAALHDPIEATFAAISIVLPAALAGRIWAARRARAAGAPGSP